MTDLTKAEVDELAIAQAITDALAKGDVKLPKPKPVYEPSPAFVNFVRQLVWGRYLEVNGKPTFRERLLHFPSISVMMLVETLRKTYGPNRTRN